LRQSGVFAGVFPLDALHAVVDAAPGEAHDALAQLVAAGLVERGDLDGDDSAYRLPLLVAEFAREQLHAGADSETVRARHADHFASVASQASAALDDGLELHSSVGRLRDCYQDAVQALGWLRTANPAGALRLGSDLTRVALEQGDAATVRAALDDVLARLAAPSEADRRDGLLASALIDFEAVDAQDRAGGALARWTEGLGLARWLGEPLPLLRALRMRVLALPATGDVDTAQDAAREGLAVAQSLGHARWQSRFESWLGMIEHTRGNYDDAARWGTTALGRALRSGDRVALLIAGMLLHTLPPAVRVDRSLLPGQQTLLEVAGDLGDARAEAILLAQLSHAAIAQGDTAQAARWISRRLGMTSRAQQWHSRLLPIIVTAMVAVLRGDHEVAARLHGSVAPHFEVVSRGLAPAQADGYRDSITQAAARCGNVRFAELLQEGALLSGPDIIDVAARYVRAILDAAEVPSRPEEFRDTRSLTARETQVLEHLMQGQRNKEIAADLGITPKSVMHHTGSIYRKLGVRSRAEAVVAALRGGLLGSLLYAASLAPLLDSVAVPIDW